MALLQEILGGVPAPRTGNAQRHELPGLLAIALAASVCGAATCVDFAEFAEDQELLLWEFLSLENGLPSNDTLSPTVPASGPCGLWAGLFAHTGRSDAVPNSSRAPLQQPC